jgi:RNA polymerase sigma factor for flagellar operon FliA
LGDLLEDTSALGPAEQVEKNELTALLAAAVDNLPERERILISLYYHDELTMKEISKVMGVSESRVCQLHMQAILRLRAGLNTHQEAESTKESPAIQVSVASSKRMRE